MLSTISDLRLRSKNETLAVLIFAHGDNNISFVEWDETESLETVGLRFKAVRSFNRKVSQRKGLASRKSDLWSKRKFGIHFYIKGMNGLAGTAIEHAIYSPSKIDEMEILQDAWDASQIVFSGRDNIIFVGNGIADRPAIALPSPKDTAIAELSALIGDAPDPVALAEDVIKTFDRSRKAKARKANRVIVNAEV